MSQHESGLDEVELSDLIGEIYDCVIDPTRWDATLDKLRGVLDCAVIISDLIELKTIEADALGHTLNMVPAGVALVAEDAEILHANSTAGRMIDEAAPVMTERGRLSVPDAATARQLHRSTRTAARNEAEIGDAGIGMALSGHAGPPATAHVLPIAGGDDLLDRRARRNEPAAEDGRRGLGSDRRRDRVWSIAEVCAVLERSARPRTEPLGHFTNGCEGAQSRGGTWFHGAQRWHLRCRGGEGTVPGSDVSMAFADNRTDTQL